MTAGGFRRLLLLVAGAAAPVAAQLPGPVVSGLVRDATTRAPLAHAQLTLAAHDGGARSDADGHFHFAVATWPDTLVVRLIGYAPVHIALATAPTAPLEILLQPAPTTLAAIVAVAGPRERRVAEMVMPVTRLDRDEITALAPASVDQLLQQLPGLQQIAAPPAASSIMIRGITDNRVLVLLDGEPAPGQLLEDRDLSRLSTIATERIEVVKGPLSAVYGSQAIGGVINMVSRAPAGALAFDLSARGGSFGRMEGSLTASAGGAVAWRATGGWRQQDRLPGQAERDGTQHHVWDGQGTMRTTLGSVSLRVDAQLFRERQRWAVGQGFYGFNDNRGVMAWTEASVPNGNGVLTLRVAGLDYAHRYRQAQSPVPYSGTGAPTQEEATWRVRLTQSLTLGAQQLDAGLETSHRRVTAADRLEGERLSDAAVEGWLQDGFSLGGMLVTIAMRATHNSRWGSALTPSLGVAFEPGATLRLRAGAARGFRGPSFKELGWRFLNPAAGYTVTGNPDLVPESSWQLFTGFTWAPTSGVTLDADLYRNTIRDMIEQTYVGTNDAGLLVYSPRNLARTRTQGLELAARYTGAHRALSLGYDRLATRNLLTGTPLSQRAPHTARLRVTQGSGAGDRVRLDLTGRWTAAAPILDEAGASAGEQGAFVSWDLGARLRVWHGAALDVGVDNVLDTRPTGWQASVQRALRIGVQAGLGG